MSKFQVGDRVVISNNRGEGVVKDLTHSGYEVFVQVEGGEGAFWYHRGNLTKIVDAPVSLAGKRVKLTLGESVVVGTVKETVDTGWHVRVEKENRFVPRWFAYCEWTLEVLPEPIVLPTGKNALVEVNGEVWRLKATGSYWMSTERSMTLRDDELEARARKGIYRVIFEGE